MGHVIVHGLGQTMFILLL